MPKLLFCIVNLKNYILKITNISPSEQWVDFWWCSAECVFLLSLFKLKSAGIYRFWLGTMHLLIHVPCFNHCIWIWKVYMHLRDVNFNKLWMVRLEWKGHLIGNVHEICPWCEFWKLRILTLQLRFPTTSELTHWGLVTPFGDIDLGQHWLR